MITIRSGSEQHPSVWARRLCGAMAARCSHCRLIPSILRSRQNLCESVMHVLLLRESVYMIIKIITSSSSYLCLEDGFEQALWIVQVVLQCMLWLNSSCCMCFSAIDCSGPAYLSELLHVYIPSRTLRSSSGTRMLEI